MLTPLERDIGGGVSQTCAGGGWAHVISIPFCELCLTNHCNLKCSGCNHYAPHLAPQLLTPSAVAADLREFASIARVEELKLAGGEPFLNPHLVAILEVVRSLAIAKHVTIITNGLLARNIDATVFALIDRLWITVYPGLRYGTRIEALTSRARDHGVHVTLRRDPRFLRTVINTRIDDQRLVRRIYGACRNAHQYKCYSIVDGRFYKCSTAPFIRLHLLETGQRVGSCDGVAVRDNPQLEQELARYLEDRKTPMWACQYCLGTNGHSMAIRQMSRSQQLSELAEDHSKPLELIDRRRLRWSRIHLVMLRSSGVALLRYRLRFTALHRLWTQVRFSRNRARIKA